MKKITFISGSLPPIRCGVGYYSHRLIEGLKQGDVKLNVISSLAVNDDLGVPLSRMSSWKIRELPRLIRLIRSQGPDIIHIQYPAVGYKRQLGINLLPYFIRIFVRKTRLIITLHEYHESRLIGRLRNLITIMPIREIIISNEADRKALPFWLGRRVTIIPIGNNIPRVKRDPKIFKALMAKQSLELNKPTLLYLGFPYPNKGLETLIQAMDNELLSEYQLLLLCDLNDNEPYQSHLIELIEGVNRENRRIAWSGFLDNHDVSAVLQEGKYFVLPQKAPIASKAGTVIAAIAHGLILISTGSRKDPTETEPFKHLINCYLIYDMSPGNLARAVGELASSPDVQKKITKGLNELSHYFSWDNITQRHLELYEKDK